MTSERLLFPTLPCLLDVYFMDLLVSHLHPFPLSLQVFSIDSELMEVIFLQSNKHCLKAVYLLLFEHVRESTCLVFHLEKIQNYSVSLV